MGSRTLVSFWGLIACIGATSASAHTRLKPTGTLITRSTASGETTAPCGSYPPTTDPTQRTTVKPGSTLVVNFEETILHPGTFRIAFSPDGVTAFDNNILMANIPDNSTAAINYVDPTTYHEFSVSVKVPTTLCESCAIQVIQEVTPSSGVPNYYSCADIRITNTPAPVTTTSTGTGSGSTATSTSTGTTATASAPVAAPAAAAPAAPQNLRVTLTPMTQP